MRVRKLDVKEHGKTRKLYEEVFPQDSQAFVDYYYSEKTKDNCIYVIEKEEEILAMLHLNPYRFMVNGREKSVNYVVAVATKEEYRGRGYMRSLLVQALKDMYGAGESFTFLMPAAEAIYLPYDFRTVYEQEHREYDEQNPTDNGVEISVLLEEECRELANTVNQYLAANFQVFAVRDEAYYQRLMKEMGSDGGKLILCRKEGEIIDCLESLEGEGYSAKPKIMTRIVDVRRMLMSVHLRSLMAVCFHITDQVIEENNRCVVITGTEYSGVMLMDSKPENSEGTITVGALTSLLFGAKTVEEVCEEEGVIMSERMKGEMKKIIPLSKIYINEIV